ncbi:16S rRNA (uracil(1498)-N(3))-methyltransferase [Candidatus Peregrinibacteria bacterium]|nr:16S rRNA (uracil(1498)-N(3))-methyltransferase [Candidatus Peregrinibacteria bacterium]
MHRFYLPQTITAGKPLAITDSRIVFHAGKVLRMRKGYKFHLFNHKAQEFAVEVLDTDRRQVLVNVVEPVENHTEPRLKVSLYQAIPKKPALFELVVQKATEIGAYEIFPLITERTEKRHVGKFERLSLIALEAAEQCGRLHIPIVRHPVVFEDAVPKLKGAYMAYEYETKAYLPDLGPASGQAQLIIGPEGGLSQKEVELAQKTGIKTFTFGPRILRTETAAISALSLLLLGGR